MNKIVLAQRKAQEMGLNNISFHIRKSTDLFITSKIEAALNDLHIDMNQVQLNYLIGAPGTFSKTQLKEDPFLHTLLESTSELIRQFNYQLAIKSTHSTIIVTRGTNEKPDELKINGDHLNQEHIEIYTLLVARLRRDLVAQDSTIFDSNKIGSNLANHYTAREAELNRLQDISESLIRGQERHRKKLESDYDQRKDQLDKNHEERLTRLKETEENLEKRLREIDDRQAKHARRQLRESLKDEIKRRNEKFELSEGTQSLRYPVKILSLILLGCLGTAFFVTSLVALGFIGKTGDLTFLTIKQIALGLAFSSTAIFYIRWENSWFERHAREEFALKRLDIDLDRASWAAELASEWVDEKKRDIPAELMGRLTDGLFLRDDHIPTEEKLHPADHLASAILGHSASVELNLPNGSGKMVLDRKTIKDLRS